MQAIANGWQSQNSIQPNMTERVLRMAQQAQAQAQAQAQQAAQVEYFVVSILMEN